MMMMMMMMMMLTINVLITKFVKAFVFYSKIVFKIFNKASWLLKIYRFYSSWLQYF
jgi:hypothetical protein